VQPQGVFIWLGASDLTIQGTWQWQTSGRAVNYTKMNAAAASVGVDQNCMIMAAENGNWYSYWCAYEQKYHVCEKPVPLPPPAPSTIESMKSFTYVIVLIKI